MSLGLPYSAEASEVLKTANKIYAAVNLAQTHTKRHNRLYALYHSFEVTLRGCHSAAHVRQRHRPTKHVC